MASATTEVNSKLQQSMGGDSCTAEGLLGDLQSVTIPPVQCSFPWTNHPDALVPPVQCSFPWTNHPDAKRVKEMSDTWIVARFGHLASGSSSFQADALVNSGFDLLTTLSFASGTPSRMLAILKYMAWIFVFDNALDDPLLVGADPSAAHALLTAISSVLDNPSFQYSGEDPLVRAMAEATREWWDDIHPGMPAAQQARFIGFSKDYLEASRRQMEYRASQCLPDLDTFRLIRANTGGWLPCTVLIEYALAIDLDEEALAHPLLVSLHSAAAYHIYWVNDLCSFRKELLENDLLNIVPVLYTHMMKQKNKNTVNVTLQGVVQEVCKMIKECDEECVRVIAEIKRSQLLMSKPGMAAYLEGVGNWVSGNLYWHLVSGRYGVCGSTDMYHHPPDFSAHHHLTLVR